MYKFLEELNEAFKLYLLILVIVGIIAGIGCIILKYLEYCNII